MIFQPFFFCIAQFFSRIFFRYFPLIFLLSFGASATPVTFSFTGTISETGLSTGISWPATNNPLEWLGKPVSGSVTIDLDRAIYQDLHDPYHKIFMTDYSSGMNASDWVTFSIVTPDGVQLNLPGSTSANAIFDSYVDLQVWHPTNKKSTFYVQRTLDYIADDYPLLSMSISLGAQGDMARFLTSSVDLDDIIVQPQFANWFNYGSLIYYGSSSSDDAREYIFTVDSLWRVTSDVPEPGSGGLAALAIFMLMLLRRIRC